MEASFIAELPRNVPGCIFRDVKRHSFLSKDILKRYRKFLILFFAVVLSVITNIASASNLTITVNNISGIRTGAKVILYNSSFVVLQTLTTDASGQVTFSNLSNAAYNYEVYYTPSGTNPPIANEEFWGSGAVTLTATVSKSFTRFQPYITGPPTFSPATFNTGQQTSGTFTVKNPNTVAGNSYVEVWVDRDQASPYDNTINNTSSATQINANASSNFPFSITPSNAGTYSYYAVVYTFINNKYTITDQYAWTPAFTVTAPSNLTLTVNNISGIQANAQVVLYNASFVALQTLTTNASGQVVFTGLPNASYTYEIYYTPTTTNPPIANEEFWGSGTVTLSGSQAKSFTRVQPYITGPPVFSPATVNTGQQTSGTFTVKNPNTVAENSYVEVWADRDKASPYDNTINNSLSATQINSGASTALPINITPANTGAYNYYAVVYTYINNKYTITDQYAWTSAFTATTASVNLTVNVTNVNNAVRDNAEVKLYNSNYTAVIQTINTNASGQAVFSNLANGSYNYEVRYTPTIINSPVSSNTEYWGSGAVSISGNSVSQTFKRIQPVIQSGPTFSPATIKTTEQTSGSFVVNNPLPYAENSYVQVWVDRDQTAPWDFNINNNTNAQSINAGSNATYPIALSSPTMGTGNYNYYAVVYSLVNGNYLITDQFNWTTAFQANPATFVWCGITWDLKNGTGGPQTNNWSSATSNVWVDAQNYLHLKITKSGNIWNCAEIDSHDPMGYGSYNFKVNSLIDRLDKDVVFGMFNYQGIGVNNTPQENEIDMEFSTWGNNILYYPNNADYTIQYRKGGDPNNSNTGPVKRFKASLTGNYTTHIFTWMPGLVNFLSLGGHYDTDPGQSFHLADFSESGSVVPPADKEKVCINLWLNNTVSFTNVPGPFDQQEVEVILQSFTFTPVSNNCTIPTAPNAQYGSDNCASPSVLNGSQTAALAFASNGGNSFKAQVSQYPYGASNIIFNSLCQATAVPFQATGLVSGMIYRWNMFAYGGTDCVSCSSPVSNTKYFSLPPAITSTATQLSAGGTITLSTTTQNPGTGATVSYRWLKDGQLFQQGSTLISINVTAPGTYTLINDYTGSSDCSGTTSTTSSNAIIITPANVCVSSTAPTSITPTVSGSTIQLAVTGGSLGTNANWKWYTGSCGSTAAGTGPSIQVVPNSGITYFVRAEGDCGGPTTCASFLVSTSSGCTASVAPTGISQVVTGNTTSGPTIQLTLTGGSLGTNASWHWYRRSCGGTPLGTGTSISISPSTTDGYFVRAEGDCGPATCAQTTVSFTPSCTYSTDPTSIIPSANNIAAGTPITLMVNGGSLGPNASWYLTTGSCGGTPAGSGRGSVFNVSPTVTTTYYLQAVGGCNTTNCVSVTVNVLGKPIINSFSPTSGITGTTVTLTGTNLDNASSVSFGSVPAQSFIPVSSTTVTAVVGTGSTGSIFVQTPLGLTNIQGFTYVFSLPVNNFTVAMTSASCRGSSNGSIGITAVQPLAYTVTITGNNVNASYPFTSTQTIPNLPAGTYSVCISVAGQAGYQQCYTVVITEPKDLAVYATVNDPAKTVDLLLTGGDTYHIMLNDVAILTTTQSNVTLNLKAGNNRIVVSSDKPCQAPVEKLINLSGNLTPYPVPFQQLLNINLDVDLIRNVTIDIYSAANGANVFSMKYVNQSGVLVLDLSKLNSGTYELWLTRDQDTHRFKIIKQ